MSSVPSLHVSGKLNQEQGIRYSYLECGCPKCQLNPLSQLKFVGGFTHLKGRDRDLSATGSLPKWRRWLGLGQAKPGALPGHLVGSKHYGHVLLLSQVL